MAVHTATCPLCEAACGLLIEADGVRIGAVRGDPDDPFSRGYICPKATALPDLQDDPDRLRAPLIREGSRWREASWDTALDWAAEGLARIRRTRGRDAVGVYYGNPVAHNLGLLTHLLPFTRALRTKHIYSASSADQLPQMLAALRMFGHLAAIPVPDVNRTDLFLLFGANPVVSNGSLMTAPNMRERLLDIRRRGGRVIVVDPRRTETAAIADEHVAIRPGTDALLLAAMLHVTFAERYTDLRTLSGRVKGLEELAAFVREYSPDRVAARTGVSPDTTRRLAIAFATTPRAACYGRVGLCTQRHGTLACWLAQALNLVTAHVDEIGTMMFPTPAVDAPAILSRLGMTGAYDRWRSPVRGLPEFNGDFPVAALADEMAGIGAFITIAGNPVLSAPNGRRLDRALGALEHMVSIDPYLNETTRHAHVILPPAPALSRAHYDVALYAFSVRNVAKYSDPVIPRAASERHDWEILAELGGRLFAPRPFRGIVARAARGLRPEWLLDLGLRLGPHRLTVKQLRHHPHGLDLGPLETGRVGDRIATRDGLIDLAPDDFVREGRARLSAEADGPAAGDSLVLIGRRQLQGNNSWMHNVARLVKGPERCTLFVHPVDAAARGISDGDLATLESDAGAIIVPIEVTDTIRPGVACLPHGWGHDREGTRLRVAETHAGVSANDVTSERYLDTLSGNAAFSGVEVRLAALTPERQAFSVRR